MSRLLWDGPHPGPSPETEFEGLTGLIDFMSLRAVPQPIPLPPSGRGVIPAQAETYLPNAPLDPPLHRRIASETSSFLPQNPHQFREGGNPK